ncbi:MAG: methionyl-tRNA formyltransferase [Planctomycetota bacterium]
MRIAFLGSGAFGRPTLEYLSRTHHIVGVVTQPDQRAGRGKKMTPTPIGAWAAEHLPSVPLIKPGNVNTDETRDLVRSWESEAWVVIAFGQKLGSELLADRFAINLHASLLPRWRGAAPINHAILAGDTETGNSVITLADRMDAGLVLGQSERAIEPDQTRDDLHNLLAGDGPELIGRVLQRHAAGSLKPVTQDESLVTLAGKLRKADGWVDFERPADEVRCRINGLSPWPAVTVGFGNERIRILRAGEAEQDTPIPQSAGPGTIIDPAIGIVACGAGSRIRLIEIQPPGKKPMSFDAFANGRRIEPGDRFIGGRPGA